jgi:hypothetical protein
MKSLLILLSLVLVPHSVFGEPKVVYFGGVDAQKSVLNKCFPSFENYGYPASSAQQRAVIDEINANPNQQYIIAGHSSGALFADNVAKAKLVNPSRITLVDLDGYAPRGVPSDIRRVCWRAASTSHPGLTSRNFSSMVSANNCEVVHTHSDAHCSTVWCMHFSIVDPNTPSGLGNGTWETQGYSGCSAKNLEWLNAELQTPARRTVALTPAASAAAK